MHKITPVSWRVLVKIFSSAGFKPVRKSGSHHVLEKEGIARPLIIPEYPEVGRDIIMNLLRTSGMSREEYLALLGKFK